MDITKCQLESLFRCKKVRQLKSTMVTIFSIVGQHPFKEVVFLRKVNR